MQNPTVFKPTSKPVFTIDYDDLATFIVSTYNLPSFEITEVNNDSTISCNTDLKFYDTSDEETILGLFKQGYCCEWHVNGIIKKLFKDGHILDGEYYVEVCW